MEYRSFRSEGATSDGEGKLSGVLAPFNSVTTIGDLKRGGWREEIAPGAFTKALKESDTVLLSDHDMSKPLARVSAGTLDLRETEKGLEFDARVAPTSYAKDTLINVKAGNKGGMSIGFENVKDEWFDARGKPSTPDVGVKRILREVKLPEGSVVTNPAYKETTVLARDDSAALLEERAAKATYADLETCGECGATGQYGAYCSGCGKPMKQSKPSGDYCTACGAKLDSKSRDSHMCEEMREQFARFDAENALYEENRASSVSAADRKTLAKKGQALPDGSYPIKDAAHLHAAAVLAASHHGNWQAAKKLIRKMAAKLGVALNTLPGFGGKGKSKSRSTSADVADERGAKKATKKRILQIDAELKQALGLFGNVDKLPEDAQQAVALVSGAAEHIEHVAHLEKVKPKDATRSKGDVEPKPDTSTSAAEDDELALRMKIRSRQVEVV
jgi:HK97 family phage prohead protease